jgi:hypothetical protein
MKAVFALLALTVVATSALIGGSETATPVKFQTSGSA